MKTTTMTNLLLLASMTFFTACSNKTVEPEKQTQRETPKQPDKYHVEVPVENLPFARTYPIIQPYYVQNMLPQYQQNRQLLNYNQIHHRENVTNYVTPPQAIYTSYRSGPSRLSRKIEWDAKKLLGKKYVWGATGPRTYDCSGFTQKIYRDAGINIPRVSRDQARVGQYVSYNHLRKGDLVFFDTHKKRTGKVTHVGIYLGNGNFIHASSGAKKIVVFNFNEKTFYKKRFLWARRVIKDTLHYAMR